MRKASFCLAVAVALGATPWGNAWAQTSETKPQAKPFEVSRVTSEIRVDGVLDDAAWTTLPPVSLDYEWTPGDNVPPPVKTTCFMGYDDDNLYVGCDAEDPKPAEIRAQFMDRDSVAAHSANDNISIMIDPFNDRRRAFQFRVNPLGVQVDGTYNEIKGGSEEFSWDAIWASSGRITEKGYTIEMAIPLRQIRFPSDGGAQTWGVSLGRNYPRSYRHRITSHPRSRSESCLLCQINKVSGFSNLEPGRNVEIDPAVTFSRTDTAAFPNGDFNDGDNKVRPGVDLRWGITPSLTLNATANPDFSQVEADVPQLAVNERFALMFPEKRTFFLEGQDFFDTPLNAVFTRTVVDPDWGAKITGKQGKNAIGVFAASDTFNSLIFPSNQGSASTLLNDDITSGVVRYRRDVGSSSTLGGLFTTREGTDYHNRVTGADAFIRLAAADDLRVQYLRSDTQYPGAIARQFRQSEDAFSGDAIYARYQHLSRKLYAYAEYQDLEPGFRTDYGFIPRVDIRSATLNVNFQAWAKKRTWWNQIFYGGFYTGIEDHSGQKTDETVSALFQLQGRYQSTVLILPQVVDQYFRGVYYNDMDRLFFQLAASPTGRIRTSITGTLGDTVDFTNNQPAEQVQLQPTLDLRMGRRVTLQVNHSYRRLDVDGGELFTANLTDLRLLYHFNLRMFVRAILQYQDIQRDPSLFRTPVAKQTETLLSQLLLSYELNPRTVLFVGYSDNQLGIEQIDLTRTDRTFFAKIGYGLIW